MKKLSKQLFHQHLKRHNKLYTDNIVIDCSDLNGKIEDQDVFAFCREVFNKTFNFDVFGNIFEIKTHKYVINKHKEINIYIDNGLSICEEFLCIDISALIIDTNEMKAALDTDLKFDPEKI